MKKQFKNLFGLFFIGLSALTVSCSSDDDNTTESQYVTGENKIDLTGEDNMRDLGGYVGVNGKRILYNKLYRSGELSALTPDDLTIVNGFEIKNIIDLRTESERNDKPDVSIQGTTRFEISLIEDMGGANTGMEDIMGLILQGQMTAEELMLPAYAVDETKIEGWKTIFNLLEEGKTSLWHCTAGKDRAGMTTALVLSSLGVDRQTIIDDFMLSNTYLADYNNQTIAYINSQYGEGVGEQLLPLLGVEEEYILAFFNDIETNYGSVENFLQVLEVDVTTMRNNYLEK